MSVYFNLRHLWPPTGFKRFVHTRVPTGTNQTETDVKMRHLRRKQTPLATSGRFRRANRPETPPSVGVSSSRRSWQRTAPARNRPEVQDPWRNRRPFPAKPSRTRGGRDHGRSLGSRKRRCGRASDIAGSCPQARPQQPPAPTANGAPAATWTHPCSKSSHIAECVLRISMANTPTTAIRLLGHCYQVFNQGRKKERSACQEWSACRRRIIHHAPAEPFQ